MKVIATTDEYTIYQKRNERYAIRKSDRSWVNGEDKVAILLEHSLIKAPPVKAPEPEPEAEASEDDAATAEADGDAAEGDAGE